MFVFVCMSGNKFCFCCFSMSNLFISLYVVSSVGCVNLMQAVHPCNIFFFQLKSNIFPYFINILVSFFLLLLSSAGRAVRRKQLWSERSRAASVRERQKEREEEEGV